MSGKIRDSPKPYQWLTLTIRTENRCPPYKLEYFPSVSCVIEKTAKELFSDAIDCLNTRPTKKSVRSNNNVVKASNSIKKEITVRTKVRTFNSKAHFCNRHLRGGKTKSNSRLGLIIVERYRTLKKSHEDQIWPNNKTADNQKLSYIQTFGFYLRLLLRTTLQNFMWQ